MEYTHKIYNHIDVPKEDTKQGVMYEVMDYTLLNNIVVKVETIGCYKSKKQAIEAMIEEATPCMDKIAHINASHYVNDEKQNAKAEGEVLSNEKADKIYRDEYKWCEKRIEAIVKEARETGEIYLQDITFEDKTTRTHPEYAISIKRIKE